MSKNQVDRWRVIAAEAMQNKHTEEAHLGECLDNACDHIRSLEAEIALLEEDKCSYCGTRRRECEACTGGLAPVDLGDRRFHKRTTGHDDGNFSHGDMRPGEPSWLKLS